MKNRESNGSTAISPHSIGFCAWTDQPSGFPDERQAVRIGKGDLARHDSHETVAAMPVIPMQRADDPQKFFSNRRQAFGLRSK